MRDLCRLLIIRHRRERVFKDPQHGRKVLSERAALLCTELIEVRLVEEFAFADQPVTFCNGPMRDIIVP